VLGTPPEGVLLTQIAGAPYEPAARSPLWEKFLTDITGGDAELEHFLHKAIGYSLTSDTSEEVMFFVYGPTATGKSTFLAAIKAAFGDYAQTVDVEAFLQKRFSSGGPAPELAKLRWTRMVISVEVDEGKRLAEGLIKLVTGGDEISVRGLYKEPETFKPRFKLWIAANNRPRVSDVDDAMWRRILVIPFTHQVAPPDRDKTLKERLCGSERAAILAWAIRGCILWQKEGLGKPPQRVEEAAADYKKEMDPLSSWVEDNAYTQDPKLKTPQRLLYKSYADWAKNTGQRYIMTEIAFGMRMSSKGFKSGKSNNVRYRQGIALLTDKGEPVREEAY
jgi:putative DNA primase/helicase